MLKSVLPSGLTHQLIWTFPSASDNRRHSHSFFLIQCLFYSPSVLHLFLQTWLFSLSGFTVSAVFCGVFCSTVTHCALCASLYETPLSCSSRARLNFSLHGPFVRESCTVIRPWHCTVEMQQDLSCVYLSSPLFSYKCKFVFGHWNRSACVRWESGGRWGNHGGSDEPINGLWSVTFLTLGAGALRHSYMSGCTANRAALKTAHTRTVLLLGWFTCSRKRLAVKVVQVFHFSYKPPKNEFGVKISILKFCREK